MVIHAFGLDCQFVASPLALRERGRRRKIEYTCHSMPFFRSAFSKAAPKHPLRIGQRSEVRELNLERRVKQNGTGPDPTRHVTLAEVRRIFSIRRKVEKTVDYRFKEEALLWEALHLPAWTSESSMGSRPVPEGNRRLAIIGDAAVKLKLAEEWYDQNQSCGMRTPRLQKLRTAVVPCYCPPPIHSSPCRILPLY